MYVYISTNTHVLPFSRVLDDKVCIFMLNVVSWNWFCNWVFISGSFGASSLKLYDNLRLGPGRVELANLQQNVNGLRVSNSQRFDGLVISQRSGKASSCCLCLSPKIAQCKFKFLFGWENYEVWWYLVVLITTMFDMIMEDKIVNML